MVNGNVDVREKFLADENNLELKIACVKHIMNLLCGSDKSIIFTE